MALFGVFRKSGLSKCQTEEIRRDSSSRLHLVSGVRTPSGYGNITANKNPDGGNKNIRDLHKIADPARRVRLAFVGHIGAAANCNPGRV